MKLSAYLFSSFVLLSIALPLRAEEDRDVVSVNGTVIRQSEVVDRLWKRYGPATLEEMIDELLLRQTAQTQGVKADEKEVEARLARLREQLPDPVVFENQLKQNGSSVEKLRAEIADQVLMRRLILSTHKISVNDEDLKKAFQNQREKLSSPPAVHLSHILVKTKPEAEEIVSKVKDGADFASLARAKSMAPTGKLNGGDYGFVSRGMLPEEIDQIAFAMKAGELRVIPSAKGFHVLRVSETRASKPAQFETVKEDLRDMILEEKMKSVLASYLQDLRAKAAIKILGGLN